MSAVGAVVGGFVGTLVLTTTLRAGSELRLTRMDLPFLLGTAFTHERARAKALGYALHLLAGQVFALAYLGLFATIGRGGWLLGAVVGLAHGVFAGTVLVNVVLPLVHPRMGSPDTDATAAPLLEPPGFMLRNYGLRTPAVSTVAHVAYGAIVGGFVALGP